MKNKIQIAESRIRKNKARKSKIRKNNGVCLTEFAAALPILLLIAFIPLLSLTSVYSLYSTADSLNKLQCDEAALLDFKQCISEQGAVKKEIPEAWMKSGFASYAKPVKAIDTQVNYTFASLDEYGFVNQWVDVDTTLTLSPFINVSYCPTEIPGLNAPCTFTFHSRKLVEDPTNAPPLLAGPRL